MTNLLRVLASLAVRVVAAAPAPAMVVLQVPYTALISDVFFFIGSSLSAWLAFWDMKNADIYMEEDDEVYDKIVENPTALSHYQTLTAMAAIMLIGNAIVDIYGALRDAHFNRGRRDSRFQICE